MLSCLSGNYRRIQCQETGLVSHFIDNREDLADRARLISQVHNRLAGPINRLPDRFNPANRLFNRLHAALGIFSRLTGQLTGLDGVTFDFLDRRVHFQHRRNRHFG